MNYDQATKILADRAARREAQRKETARKRSRDYYEQHKDDAVFKQKAAERARATRVHAAGGVARQPGRPPKYKDDEARRKAQCDRMRARYAAKKAAGATPMPLAGHRSPLAAFLGPIWYVPTTSDSGELLEAPTGS
jgi:hypothetical protein